MNATSNNSGRDQGLFAQALSTQLALRGIGLQQFLGATYERLAERVTLEYGALYVASLEVDLPPFCVFNDERQVQEFQSRAGWKAADIAGVIIELQPAAMNALLTARDEANSEGLTITARGGSEAGRRGFDDTVRLWESRYYPALEHWLECGKLSNEEVCDLRATEVTRQVTAVLDLEARGLFFSKDFSKSIFYSVAPPGASQHLSMLAFDVAEFQDPRVRAILARRGWFQTVQSDLPHFTYLGLDEHELPKNGLRCVESCGQTFWVPDLEA